MGIKEGSETHAGDRKSGEIASGEERRPALTGKAKLLLAMGFSLLAGFLTVGFFTFPVGLPLCGVAGMVYGRKQKDKTWVRGSAVVLIAGIALFIYMVCLIRSM